MAVIVFDLDGVLIDSREANIQAFSEGLRALGIEVPEPDRVASLIGLSAHEMLVRLGAPNERVAQNYNEVVKPYYLEHLPRLASAVADAAEVLAELRRRGHRVVACTSGGRALQEQALQQIGLWDYFEAMQTPDDSAYRKPQVDYMRELLTRLGAEDQTIVHVEDSQVGLQMGLDYGAVTVFADYGYGRPDPLQPHYRIDRLLSLLQLPEAR